MKRSAYKLPRPILRFVAAAYIGYTIYKEVRTALRVEDLGEPPPLVEDKGERFSWFHMTQGGDA